MDRRPGRDPNRLYAPPPPFKGHEYCVDGDGNWYANRHGTALTPVWSPCAPPSPPDDDDGDGMSMRAREIARREGNGWIEDDL